MCGIAGLVAADRQLPDAARLIEAMTARLVHRGPDGSGHWIGDGVALGQRRLSIIDLSENGRQPMASADGRYQLVCNGEIYNFQELRRREVEYRYRSHTDVEVILPLYERHGDRAVEHLVGMFAIGIWDEPKRRLLLARDRIGEKPLYYAQGGGRFAFASEIKALLELPWVDRGLDEEAVPYLLAYQSLPAPFTIYRGIRQLGPAQRLVWQDGRISIDTYWRVDFSKRPRSWSASGALDTYGQLMRQAVKGQLIADVPVGVMLSGGIDSTTIARLAKEQDPAVRTFCIGTAGAGSEDEEQQRAKAAAGILETAHKTVAFDALTPRDFVRVLAHYDQPFPCLVALYADALAREMRREVKVVLSGNGADEVFAGYAAYPRLGPIDLARRLAGPMAPMAARLLAKHGGERVRRNLASVGAGVADWRGGMLTEAARSLLPRVATPDFAARWRGTTPGDVVANIVRESGAQTMLEAATISDLMVCHQHGHSVIADMSGMTHGLELRAPFLDHRVVEFAASLQPSLRIGHFGRPGDAKWIAKAHLRQVMPDWLIDAKKIGFGYGIPLDTLLRQTWRPATEDLLLNGRYLELGIFSAEGARWALENSYYATVVLLSFAIFGEVHLFGQSVDAVAERLESRLAGRRAA